jgi:DNA polymerase III delta prime subunit
VVEKEDVKMGPGGMDALVALGGGDMRRSLNILQVRAALVARLLGRF